MHLRRHSFILQAVFSIFAFVCVATSRVIRAVAASVAYFIQTTPVTAALAMLPNFKPALFRVLKLLKPVYRESIDTNGQSLPGARY